MAAVVLSVARLENEAGWRGSWSLDGRTVGPPVVVSGDAAKSVEQLGEQFAALFEQAGRPLTDPEALRSAGRALSDTWFKPVRESIRPQLAGDGNQLLIQSTDPQILNLPWELVELMNGLPVGCDAAWSLRRTPLDKLSGEGALDPGHLRILFAAAAPVDQAALDYEREEDAMLRATGKLRNVAVRFAETGSATELAELVAEFRPHVVHLSGHGQIDGEGHGTFAFEDERGHTDSRDAESIVAEIFRGSPVRCVFWNGCETAQAAVSGLCQALVAAGMPLALGWAAPVADDLATEFAEEFYRRLVSGETVEAAAAHARELIRRRGKRIQMGAALQDATFALPQLYCSVARGEVFDRSAPRRVYEGPRTEYALLGDGIKGLREGYVGRRREGQTLLPPLREGEVTVAVITGIGGAGKSTLATRAANRLREAGFRIVPVRTAEGKSPEDSARATLVKLTDAIDRAFLAEHREDLHNLLTNGQIAMEQRLRLAVDGLNDLRVLLVLDNFEDALVLDTRRIADPELALFYTYLSTHLTRGSRLIVTCRYLPADTPAGQMNVSHLPLPDLEHADFLKFLRRDPLVDARIRTGELTEDLLGRIYRVLGGTPGFLEAVRRVLQRADADDLFAELEGDEAGELTEQRDAYYQHIFATRLYDALSSEAQALVSRLAVSESPLPLDGVMKVTGLDEDDAATCLDECVAFGLVEPFHDRERLTLYHSPGLLRPWLAAEERLPASNAREVHQRLAAFWRSSYEEDREIELRVPIDVELAVCREHGRRSGDMTTFQWATVRLALRLENRTEWRIARLLLEEVPESSRDGHCLLALAGIESSLGEWHSARQHLELALETFPDATKEKGAAWNSLALIDLNEGNHAAARAKFEKSLEIRQAVGDRIGEAATWHNLASIDAEEGNYAAARGKFEKSLEIKRASGARADEAATWHNLASIDFFQGNYPAARVNIEKSLEIAQMIGDRAGEAAGWHGLASVDLSEGKSTAARAKLQKSLEIRRAIGDRAGEAVTLHNLAALDFNEGNYVEARAKCERSLKVRQTIGDRSGEAGAMHQLATIDLGEGNYGAARIKFERSLEIERKIGNRANEAATWHQLGTLDLREGNYAPARAKFEKSLDIKQAIGDRAGEAATLSQLGALAFEIGSERAGARLMAMCWIIDRAIGHGDAESDLRNLLARCSTLGLKENEISALINEAAASYERDRGWRLIGEAFGEDGEK